MAYDGEIIIDTSLDTKGLMTGLDGLNGKVDKALNPLNLSLTAITAGFMALGKASLGFGVEFEAQMSKVGAISGASVADMGILTQKAKEMGASTKFSATESGQAFEYMSMAGWKATEMLSGIEGIMNASAASGESLASVADIITDGLTAFGMAASEATRFSDVLASASSNSNTNIGMMGETFKYVAPIAGALGYAVEDVSVAIGLMANSSIKGSQAGTALRGLLTNLVKPTKESATAMKDLNISLTNSDGSMKDFGEVLQDMRKGFEGLTESQRASYSAMLAGQEGMSGLLAIVNTTESDFNKLTTAIDNSEGSAKKMADTMIDNVAGQMVLLKSSLEGAGITISEILAPAISTAISFVQGLVDGFNGLPEPVQRFITIAGATVAILGTAVTAITAVKTASVALATINGLLTASTVATTVATTASTVATVASAGAIKVLTATMLASPLFGVAIASLAIGLIVTAVDALTNSYARQEEKIRKLSTAYDEHTDKLSTIKEELEGVASEIDEINKKDPLSLTENEKEMLETLKAQSEELRIQYAIEENLLEISRKKAEQETLKLLEKPKHSKDDPTGDPWSRGSFVSYDDEFKNQITLVETLSQKIESLKQHQLELIDTGQQSSRQFRENNQSILESETALLGLKERTLENAQSLQEYSNILMEAKDVNGEYSEQNLAHQETLQGLMDIMQSSGLLVGAQATEQEKLNTAIDASTVVVDILSDSLESLKTEFNSGAITSGKYTEALEEQLKEVDALKDANPELADSYKQIATSISKELSKSPEYLKKLSEATRGTISETKKLEDALAEQSKNGQLSADTILDLIDSGYALAVQIDAETGAVTINEEALKRLNDAKVDAQIANLNFARSGIEAQIRSEGMAALGATGNFIEYAKAIIKSRQAFKGEIADLDVSLALLENAKNKALDPSNFKSSGGGGGGGGGKSSKAVKEKKEEVSEIIKTELDLLDRQKELGEISAGQVYANLKDILANRKLNSKEQEEIEKRLFKAKETYFEDEKKLIDDNLKKRLINSDEAYDQNKKLYSEMLKSDHLYAKNKKQIEDNMFDAEADYYDAQLKLIDKKQKYDGLSLEESYIQKKDIYKRMLDSDFLYANERTKIEEKYLDVKNEILKESTSKYVDVLKEEEKSRKEMLKEEIDSIKDKEYQKIEIVGETTNQIYDILSDGYIQKIALIDEETGVYLDGANSKMKAELELLSVTNKEAFDKITALRAESEAIKESQKARRESEKEESNARKLSDLREKESLATDEERLRISEQILDFEKQLSKEAQESSENKKIEENQKAISDLLTKQKEDTKLVTESMKEYKTATDDIVANLSKTHQLTQDKEIETYYKSLIDGADGFIKQFAENFEELNINDIVKNALKMNDIGGTVEALSEEINKSLSENLVIDVTPKEARISLFGTGSMESDKKMFVEATQDTFEAVNETISDGVNNSLDTLEINKSRWKNAGEQLAYAYWDGLKWVMEQIHAWIQAELAKQVAMTEETVSSFGFGVPWAGIKQEAERARAFSEEARGTMSVQGANMALPSSRAIAPSSISSVNSGGRTSTTTNSNNNTTNSGSEPPNNITNNFYGYEREETAFRASKTIERELRGFRS